MQISIVEKRPDSATAAQLLAELDAHLLAHPYPQESRHAFSIDKLVREGVAFFVTLNDGKPAGCGGLKLFGSEYGEIKRMYVRPIYRGLGLGKAMLNRLAEHAQRQDVKLLRLETGIYETEAIGLYERFGKRILVDVSPFAWEFGAYTVGEGESAHVVVSSTDPGYQCFAALEMLMHEPSHAIVAPASHAIGTDLKRISEELGVKPRPNLWHAILFYTSGELTRRALVKRSVHNYQPYIAGMYERGFRGFKQPLETHWQAYLDGKVSREAAIRQILIETTPPKK